VTNVMLSHASLIDLNWKHACMHCKNTYRDNDSVPSCLGIIKL
jgi:hypothetical protein